MKHFLRHGNHMQHTSSFPLSTGMRLSWKTIFATSLHPRDINCTLAIFFSCATEHKVQCKVFCKCTLRLEGKERSGSVWFWSHLVLLDLVLGRVLPLAFSPELLQVRLWALQGVLLQLVLGLIALEGGLQMFDRRGTRRVKRWTDKVFMNPVFLRCTEAEMSVHALNANCEILGRHQNNN